MKRLSVLFVIFLKGIFMGAADIVPGVSGGTIALITGIYERFINSIASLRYLLKLQFKKIAFPFLLPLGAGILFSILTLSSFLSRSIEHFPGRTFGFFTGLIIVSVHSVFMGIKKHRSAYILIAAAGFAISFTAASLTPHTQDHISLVVYFLSGFAAVSAMMLPGISGSFILLLFGTYSAILENIEKTTGFISGVHNDPGALIPLFVLSAGILTGLITTSGLIRRSLLKHRDETLYLLTGFILGAIKKPLWEMHASGESAGLLFIFTIAGLICGVALELWGNISHKGRPEHTP